VTAGGNVLIDAAGVAWKETERCGDISSRDEEAGVEVRLSVSHWGCFGGREGVAPLRQQMVAV
jgi:hypothetical protein